MRRSIRAIEGVVVACLLAAALAGCGGGGASSVGEDVAQLANENDVAQVGSHVITKALLNEWMRADLGSDYYEVAKRRVPAGLVSEPANYSACESALKKSAASLDQAGLRSKCEELYQAIKIQTLTFLVGAYWDINFGAGHGVSVSDAEVQQTLEQVKAKEYPKPGQFEASLRARRRTPSQEHFLAQIDLLERRLSSEDKQNAKLRAEAHSAASNAICRAEYVVPHCKEPESVYSGSSVSTLVRELAK